MSCARRKKLLFKGKSTASTSSPRLNNEAASQKLFGQRSKVLKWYKRLCIYFILLLAVQFYRPVLDILEKEKLHSQVSGGLRAGALKQAGSADARWHWDDSTAPCSALLSRVPSAVKFAQAAAFNWCVHGWAWSPGLSWRKGYSIIKIKLEQSFSQ